MKSNVGDSLSAASLDGGVLGSDGGLLSGVGSRELTTEEVEGSGSTSGGNYENSTVLDSKSGQGEVANGGVSRVKSEGSRGKTINVEGVGVSGKRTSSSNGRNVEGTSRKDDSSVVLDGLG